MPTANKVLVVLVIVLALTFVYLSAFVLEARSQWNSKIQAKAADAARASRQVTVLEDGTEEARSEFQKLAEEVLRTGSDAARAEFQKRLNDAKIDGGVATNLVTSKIALEAALDKFVDQRVIEVYHEAAAQLNELEKTAPIEETQFQNAVKAFDAAEQEVSAARNSLDNAYATFLGEQSGGIREIVSKGLFGVDTVKSLITGVQHAISGQRAVLASQIGDRQRNLTVLQDRVREMMDTAETLRQSTENTKRESEELYKEVAQAQEDLTNEQEALEREIARRDEVIQALDDLRQRYAEVSRRTRQLAQTVKEAEIRVDAMRGIKTALVSPDGLVPKGKVQTVEPDDGTIHINLGTRVGVKPGVQLHVYRFLPEPKYLGLLEIASADSDSAVGRMLPEYRQLTIRPGDNVSTEIAR